MRAKSLLLLIIALGCGTVASVGISQVMMEQKNQGPAEIPTTEIYVAVKDIDVNERLTAEHVKLEPWPQNRVPEGAISQLDAVTDRYVRQRMYPGEPILSGKLNDSIVGVDTEIPKGYRVFDLSVNERNGGSGYIKPGARVDVLGTFKVNNVTESRTVMRNVRIFGINGVTVRDDDPTNTSRATTFQLLVHESQMDALNLATALGELRCTLRGTVENQDTSSATDTGEAFISWVRGADTKKTAAAPTAVTPPNLEGSSGFDIFGSLVPQALASATEEKKKELLIITPGGVTKYQWSQDDEMPQRVEPSTEQPVQALSEVSGGFIGTGGYTPTYPTSTSKGSRPGAPGDAPSPAEKDPSAGAAGGNQAGASTTGTRPPKPGM